MLAPVGNVPGSTAPSSLLPPSGIPSKNPKKCICRYRDRGRRVWMFSYKCITLTSGSRGFLNVIL